LQYFVRSFAERLAQRWLN